MYTGSFSPSTIVGRSSSLFPAARSIGKFYIELNREGENLYFNIEPYPYEGADAYVSASYEHFMGMAEGKFDDDKLFQTGQLKVEGNLAKAAELRYLIHKN